jgi:oligopeptide transport system substrate-binding protein
LFSQGETGQLVNKPIPKGKIVKKQTPRIVLVQVLTIFAIFLSACVPNNGDTSEQNGDAPTEIPELKSSPEPVVEPIAGPTVYPTARPLLEESPEVQPGIYVNDVLGVTLEYPTSWEVMLESQSDFELLMVRDPNNSLLIYFTSYILEEEMTLEESLVYYMEFLGEELGLQDLDNIEIDPAFLLGNGLETWHGVIRSDEDDDTFITELIGIERAGRIFTLWFIGWEQMHDYHSAVLEEVRQSLELYSPTPYGVDRENAFFSTGGEPKTLDPAKHQGSADSYIGDLFSGLVRLDANLQPIPDLAERWEVSLDGLVYTFYLRQNVTFHNGRPFTSEDVKFSWDRAASPELESPTVGTYLTDIVGVQQVMDGEAEEISGFKIIDEYTVEVTLDAPKVYFLHKLAYPTSWIVDRETEDEIDENPVGTGPFKFAKHVENEIIILARNENYHLGFVPLEYLVYLLYQGPSIRLYEGGQIDILVIDEDLLGRAEDPIDPLYGIIQPIVSLCTSMVRLDASMAPFDDLLVREAFSRAIDKDRYNLVIAEGKGVIANGVYPPGLPGYNPDLTPLSYDPERALEAITNSSYGSVDAFPEIIFTTSGGGGGIDPSDALLIEMWEKVLGVTVTVEQIDSRSYLEKILEGEHGQIFSWGWCADYPDPENFADVLFHSDAQMNTSNYSNPEIDALLERARSEPDVSKRITLYQEIEQMLVDDVAAIFLIYGHPYYLVTKPYVQNYVATPIGIAQMMNIVIEH